MKVAIETIISKIPKDKTFDSHFIINQLIKNYSNEYLNFASSINAENEKTIIVHGKIGQEIAKYENSLISRMDNLSWSDNIHGKSSECTLWKKLI